MANHRAYQDALESRAKRLVQLVAVSAPEQIIGQEIALVMEAALGYCPKETISAIAQWLCAKCQERNSDANPTITVRGQK